MHLAELCIDLLHQNEEHHAEVNKSFSKASSLHCWTVFGTPSIIIGSFSNDDGDVKENGKKAIETTALHVHHAFLYISLPSLHDYDDVKMPMQIHLLWRTWKNEHKAIALISFKNSTPEKLAIWRIQRDGIRLKFEEAQIHFFEGRARSRPGSWYSVSWRRLFVLPLDLSFTPTPPPFYCSTGISLWQVPGSIGVGAHGWQAWVC